MQPHPPAIAGHIPQTIKQLLQGPIQDSAEVTAAGWVRTVRHSKQVSFLALGDGSGAATLQVVLGDEMAARDLTAAMLTTGTSVRVTGRLVPSPKGQQDRELIATDLQILGVADAQTFPLQKKGHSLEFLRTIASLRPRTNTFGAVLRIRASLAQATHQFFDSYGFAYVHTPIITTSDCEGAGEMFEVTARGRAADEPFFGSQAYLTVSGQLAGEALAYGLGRIYTFGPTFRAENSNTARHLAEFWMIEPEMAFFDAGANRQLAQSYLQHCIGTLLTRNEDDLAFLAKHYDKQLIVRLQQTATKPFVHISYTQAVTQLEQTSKVFAYPVKWGNDLQSEHERYLVEEICQAPVVVTDYPADLKSFYMYQNDDNKTVAAMDILVPGIGEIIGGSQREHRLERLEDRLAALNMPKDPYAWYLDLHRFGAVPHAGFGLGFERLVMLCTGMTNIRDTIAFPRAPGLAPG